MTRHRSLPRRAPRGGRNSFASAEIEVEIGALAGSGEGTARHGGAALRVPFAAPGDRLRVRTTAAGHGEIVQVIQAGRHRREPPCPHFGICGGCALQHLDDDAYAAWKRDRVARALAPLGDLPPVALLRSPAASRRRATLMARRERDRVALGFNAARAHRIVDIAECPVLDPALFAELAPLRPVLAAILADRETADIALAATETGIDLVVMAAREPGLYDLEALAAHAEARDLARISWQSPAALTPIAERRRPRLRFGGVAVDLPPGAFLQATEAGEAAIAAAVTEAVADSGFIADLYAGCGTLTFPLAAKAKVHAVEGDPPLAAAIQRAAAGLAGRVTVERRDLAHRPLTPEELAPFAAVVFDPPRAGAAAQARALAQSAVPLVVGVSCNPATFVRDARLLIDGGYRLRHATAVDQFLWSPHVELVALFQREAD